MVCLSFQTHSKRDFWIILEKTDVSRTETKAKQVQEEFLLMSERRKTPLILDFMADLN